MGNDEKNLEILCGVKKNAYLCKRKRGKSGAIGM